MTSGRELITDALIDLNVYGPGEAIRAPDANLGLRHLNQLLDSLALDRSWLHAVATVDHPLVAGTASYTLGTGGQINVPRPDFLPEAAGLIQDDTADTPIESPLAIFSDQEWQGIGMKTLESTFPQGIYPDFSFSASGLMRLYVWPIPTGDNQTLRLYLPAQAVARFATLDTTYLAPRGYERALRLALTKELCPPFERPLPPLLMELASQAMDLLMGTNQRDHLLRADDVTMLAQGSRAGVTQGGWDIRRGGWR